MDNFFEDFLKVMKAFEEQKVDYVLIGGFAVILHGLPRLTQDMDIFVKLTLKNVENLKTALHRTFSDESIKEISTQDLGRYSVIRYGTPGGFVIDIISQIGEAFRFEDIQMETLMIQGVKIKVATPETLLKMKKDTPRDKDKMDAVFLRQLIAKGKEGTDARP